MIGVVTRWYVVDQLTGVRYEPGHADEPSALLELADRLNDLPGDNPGRYAVEQQDVTPQACAVLAQGHNR